MDQRARSPAACQECDRLRAEVAGLRATVKALRIMVADLGGLPPETAENMYEDESKPDWMWEKEERE